MIPQSDIECVAPKWRPVLFPKYQERPLSEIRRRVLFPAGFEILPIQNAVVLIGYQRTHDVHALRVCGHQQVRRRVAQVPAIVHVHMR